MSCFIAYCFNDSPVLKIEDFSSFTQLKRITAWIFRFIHTCHRKFGEEHYHENHLAMNEIQKAEVYWYVVAQQANFAREISEIKAESDIHRFSSLVHLRPFIDSSGLLRIGGRQQHSKLSFTQKHSIILHQKHSLTHLIV